MDLRQHVDQCDWENRGSSRNDARNREERREIARLAKLEWIKVRGRDREGDVPEGTK